MLAAGKPAMRSVIGRDLSFLHVYTRERPLLPPTPPRSSGSATQSRVSRHSTFALLRLFSPSPLSLPRPPIARRFLLARPPRSLSPARATSPPTTAHARAVARISNRNFEMFVLALELAMVTAGTHMDSCIF